MPGTDPGLATYLMSPPGPLSPGGDGLWRLRSRPGEAGGRHEDALHCARSGSRRCTLGSYCPTENALKALDKLEVSEPKVIFKGVLKASFYSILRRFLVVRSKILL